MTVHNVASLLYHVIMWKTGIRYSLLQPSRWSWHWRSSLGDVTHCTRLLARSRLTCMAGFLVILYILQEVNDGWDPIPIQGQIWGGGFLLTYCTVHVYGLYVRLLWRVSTLVIIDCHERLHTRRMSNNHHTEVVNGDD